MRIAEQKSTLRKRMLDLRAKMPLEERALYESQINAQLVELVSATKVQTLHTFLPMEGEVNHVPFINHCMANNITVVMPKTLRNRKLQHFVFEGFDKLEDGIFGTRHPANAREWNLGYDVIIVPGLAFDAAGNRLGYGAGYYDAFLANHPEVFKAGICFPQQLLNHVPSEAFDVRMDVVISSNNEPT